MLRYLFNGRVQIFNNENFTIHYYTNMQKQYGDDSVYNNILQLGYISFCW